MTSTTQLSHPSEAKKRVYEDLPLPVLKKPRKTIPCLDIQQNIFLYLIPHDPVALLNVQLVCKDWCALYRDTDIYRQLYLIGRTGKGKLSKFVETYYKTALQRTYYENIFDYNFLFSRWKKKNHLEAALGRLLKSSLVTEMTDKDFVAETLIKGIIAHAPMPLCLDSLEGCQNNRIASIFKGTVTIKQRFIEWKTDPTLPLTAKLINGLSSLPSVCPRKQLKLDTKIRIKGNWQRTLCEAWELRVVKEAPSLQNKLDINEPLQCLSSSDQLRFLRIFIFICNAIKEPIPYKLLKSIAALNPQLFEIRDTVLEVVASNGLGIEFATAWHDDTEIVNLAIKQNRQAKKYIAAKLK